MSPGSRRCAPHVGLCRGEQGGVRSVRGDGAAGRGPIDRRGVPRRAWAGEDFGQADRDRGEAATPCRPARRPADHRWSSTDQVPREGCERRGQARRPAACAGRRGAGLPAPPARRKALGRGASDVPQAAPPGDHARRRDRRPQRAGVGLDHRSGVGAPPARAVPQPGPSSGARAPPPSLDRVTARPRPVTNIARRDRYRGCRPRRPRHSSDARVRARRAHRRPALALR